MNIALGPCGQRKARRSLRERARSCFATKRLRTALSTAILAAGCSSAAFGQSTTQQRVYGAASSTTTTAILPAYNKDGTTGALSLLPGAPFADRLEGGLIAIDGQGKFLFVLNPASDNISMFQIDGSTGALAEVPNSPFGAGPTVNPNLAPSLPISIAAEKSGNFLYVGYAEGDSTTTSAVVPFSIDATNQRLTLTAQLALDFGNGAPVQMQSDTKGLHLYVGMGPGGSQSNSSAGTLVFSIDPTSGILTQTGNAGGGSDRGRSIAVDPQGRFFFDGWGGTQGFLDAGPISPVDGTSNVSSTVDLGVGTFATVLLIDSSGKFLYAQTGAGLLIYSIDGSSGALTQLSGPLAQFSFKSGTVVADPAGPFLYSLGHTGVDVLQIDAATGSLTEIPNSPFSNGASGSTGPLGLAVTGAAVQSVSGPAAQVFPASTDFGQIVLGQTSGTKIVSVANSGDQALAVSSITVSGADAGDFAQSNTCGATVAANGNCSVSLLFTPSHAGPEQAQLVVNDNAPGSPQSATLTGTGVAAQSSVTLQPATVNFGSVAEGVTMLRTVQVTNSGTSVLHISSVALSGSNPGDFAQSNNCTTAPVAVQGSCSITVSFMPQTQALRSASLLLTDDAGGSPQSVALSGSGVAAFQFTAAAGATTATVHAGQTAQYNLQITPGPGFSGNVSLSCAGAPTAAVCSVSAANMALANGVASAFQVTVTTTGNGTVAPVRIELPGNRIWVAPTVMVVSLWMLAVLAVRARRMRWTLAATCCLLLVAAGCGGGGSTPTSAISDPPPQPVKVVTPLGTTNLTVTAQSGNLPVETLRLTLTVD